MRFEDKDLETVRREGLAAFKRGVKKAIAENRRMDRAEARRKKKSDSAA